MKENQRSKLQISSKLVDEILNFSVGRSHIFYQLFSKLSLEEVKNLKTNYEVSILHVAGKNSFRDTEILEFLLNQGFDPNEQDLQGNTVLHNILLKRSKMYEHNINFFSIKAFEILLKKGASLNIQNNLGQTPLMLDNKEINKGDLLSHILEKKYELDLSIQDKAGNSLFHYYLHDHNKNQFLLEYLF